jgi:hypothetical protein
MSSAPRDTLSALSRVQRQKLIRLVMSIAKHAPRHPRAPRKPGADKRISTRFYRPVMRSFAAWRD